MTNTIKNILATRRFWLMVGTVVLVWNLWKLGLWVQSQMPTSF